MAKELVIDLSSGEVVERDYAPVATDPPPPRILSASIIANALLKVQGGVMNGIDTACGFSFAFAMGPGSYLLFFSESQPDTAYTCFPCGSTGQITPIARDVDFIELLATENGVPTDPAEINIQVVRVG